MKEENWTYDVQNKNANSGFSYVYQELNYEILQIHHSSYNVDSKFKFSLYLLILN